MNSMSFPQAQFETLATHQGVEDEWETTVPVGSACFDGHFQGAPILPGVAHLALILEACSRRFGNRCVLAGIGEVRWRRPVKPGDKLTIALTGELSDPTVRFSIRCGSEVASSGVIAVAAVGERDA
jgi:3-hydroxymyristoyl/3-hydroxydecanoyl-(acyl carrier protein) dehydratase